LIANDLKELELAKRNLRIYQKKKLPKLISCAKDKNK